MWFGYLSRKNTLKSLTWIMDWINEWDTNDERMIDVMEKIQHLNIEVPLIKRFTFNMDNLTKLSLYELKDYENDMENNIIFQNVKILKIDDFTNANFNWIWHFQFSKLELVYMKKMIQTKIPD